MWFLSRITSILSPGLLVLMFMKASVLGSTFIMVLETMKKIAHYFVVIASL